MGSSQNWRGFVRDILYSVMFAPDPMQAVDHVFRVVIDRGDPRTTPQDYLQAFRQALASGEALSRLLPQNHSEEVLRRFLTELQRRLAARLGREDVK